MNALQGLIGLFFPDVCLACGSLLTRGESSVCLSCNFLMPKTAYETIPDNPVARIFWGRVPLHAASACYFFAKKGRIQPLIHSLKYRSNKGIGLYLGQQLGTSLIEAPLYQDVQLIVPVPLHPKKKHIRGYNQAEVIANGMAKVMKLPVVTDNLIRSVATET